MSTLDGQVIQEDIKYCPPFVINGYNAYKVYRLGYPWYEIKDSLQHNKANHCATTYYLLDTDHKRIC